MAEAWCVEIKAELFKGRIASGLVVPCLAARNPLGRCFRTLKITVTSVNLSKQLLEVVDLDHIILKECNGQFKEIIGVDR